MSTERHPLDEALEDAERAGADYALPVELVRTRVRHRRRARAVARGGVAFAVVAAVAVTLPATLGAWDGKNGTMMASLADWPAEFDRCGEPVAVVPDDDAAPFTVTIEEPDGSIGADRVSRTEARIRVDPWTATEVRFAGAEASLLRDGIVVAVADVDAPVTVPLSEVPPAEAGEPSSTRWGFATVLVSCAQYPDGRGDPRVPAGTYELAVTHTIGWHAPDGTEHATRVSRQMPVTVTEDDPATALDPTACLADASALAGLAGPEANPFPVTLDADVPATAEGGPLRFTVVATNEGTSTVDARVERPAVLLTRDGEVVATPSTRPSPTVVSSFSPGASLAYDAESPLVGCVPAGTDDGPGQDDPQPLAPGDYEVWVTLGMQPTGSSSGDDPDLVRLLYGPWPLTLP